MRPAGAPLPAQRWRFGLPLALLLTLVALVVYAAPAAAWEPWEHGGADEDTCDSSGCHQERASSNTSCLASSCHAGFQTSGSQKCWRCHRPGQSTSSWRSASGCTAVCHLEDGDRNDYASSFSHGTSPHLGASGYGKTCTDCHGLSASTADQGGSPHHDAAGGHAPSCLECHNGVMAPAQTGHEGRSSVCSTCHLGMTPTTDCATCHVGNAGSGGPQITYTNDLPCGDAGCHGRVANHAGTPVSSAPCITCHTEHYATLGTCETCHRDPESFHHGTAVATPLSDCLACHDGTIAARPPGHESFGTQCADCHDGMVKPPSDCLACHSEAQGDVAAVVYTNDLTCGDARCHSMVPVHSGTPIRDVSCTTCHLGHYETLGTCETCHTDPPRFHHGTDAAVPLADCAGCHDGGIGVAKEAHAGMSCTACHDDMTAPPVPATCHTCHDAGTFGQGTCTGCHGASGIFGEDQVHSSAPDVVCGSCHVPHYEDVGGCDTCHEAHAAVHHGTATPAATTLTASAKPRRVRRGARVTLRGSLRGAGGAALAAETVLLQRRTSASAPYRTVARLTTRDDGRFSRTLRPRSTTQYRLVWTAAGAAAAQQPAVKLLKVRVRRR